jgi:hypothetical protein
MGDVRSYRYSAQAPYQTKSGEYRFYNTYVTNRYVCVLHHPDAAEMAQIRAELAAGRTKKDVARRHNLGNTNQRLNRLLAKYPEPVPEPVPEPPVQPALALSLLADEDIETLLSETGWL